MAVIASLVVGANGACSIDGQSRGLSTPPDRERFLERHRSASAFIIGKQSSARERYKRVDIPIFVFTRETAPLRFEHPMMQQVNSSFGLKEIVTLIDERIEGNIVVESGPLLLMALAREGCIDHLELSISPIVGDGDFIDVDQLLDYFTIEEEELIEGTRLLKCRDKGNSADG
jgi:riboflavin biosynthesis pyrimidine reductase